MLLRSSLLRSSVIFLVFGSLSPVPCIAQSTTARCNNLYGRFVATLEEERKVRDAAPKDYGSNDYDERRLKWLKECEDAWEKVVAEGRKYLGECPNSEPQMQTEVLKNIAEGLRFLGKGEDAIPVLRRCFSIDPDNSSCWDELGNVEIELCRFADAKAAFQKVIEVGGFTQLNAIIVDEAKSQLSVLENPDFLERMRTRFSCPAPSDNGPSAPTGSSETKRFGSGFYVTAQGHILTNNHVVEGCKTLATRDGKPLVVVDRDAKSDLALLKADTTPDVVATFRTGAAPKSGDAVIVFGYPLADILSSEGNVSTGVISATAGLGDDIRFIQISAPVQPGNSGGPLMDASGHVIGVVVAKLDALRIVHLTGDVPQNVNFAVHWSEVRAFLDREGITYRRAVSSSASETHTIASEAKRFSVRIDCSE
jgi:S1-C subfamily serine protease